MHQIKIFFMIFMCIIIIILVRLECKFVIIGRIILLRHTYIHRRLDTPEKVYDMH